MLLKNNTRTLAYLSPSELSGYLFTVRLILLFIVCALVRGARVCKLRRGVFGPPDTLWVSLDVLLCANPMWRAPTDPATHLRAFFHSTRLSLFLFGGVPLFVAATEHKRRGLAVLVISFMALQRSAAAMLTQNPSHVALAALTLRPMWLTAAMMVDARAKRHRGEEHVV